MLGIFFQLPQLTKYTSAHLWFIQRQLSRVTFLVSTQVVLRGLLFRLIVLGEARVMKNTSQTH